MKLIKPFTHLLMLFSALVLLGGFGGAYHPLGDSLAVFRHYALFGLLVALVFYVGFRQRLFVLVLLLLLGVGLFSMRMQLAPTEPVNGLRILQSNLMFRNDARLLVDYARAEPFDVITLQEVTTKAIPQLAALRADYPYQVVCPFGAVGGVAILSKHPFLGPHGQGCSEGLGMVWARVELPENIGEGAVTVVSVHLHWPWPYGQAAQLSNLMPKLKKLSQPIIIAGDFNMVPWSVTLANIETASHTQIIGGLRFTKTLFGGLVQLPIDHVLAPQGARAWAKIGPRLGSDHASIIANIDL